MVRAAFGSFALALAVSTALVPAVALAEPAVVDRVANVRDSSDGVDDSEIVSTTQKGERVEVGDCENGYCFVVRKKGESGWVYQAYLTLVDDDEPVDEPADDPQPDDGDDTDDDEDDEDDGDDDAPDADDEDDEPEDDPGKGDDDQAGNDNPPNVPLGRLCIFLEPNFQGEMTCFPEGVVLGTLDIPGSASLLNPYSIEFTACSELDFGGECNTISTDVRQFGRTIRSLAVGSTIF